MLNSLQVDLPFTRENVEIQVVPEGFDWTG